MTPARALAAMEPIPMNMKNLARPYSKRRFDHVNKMLFKLQQRDASENRIARADRAVDAAMIPF